MKGVRIRPRKRPTPGSMGKLEETYARLLDEMEHEGKIIGYRFEAMRLKLAPNTFYTPDFIVTFDDHIELHETKGFWEDDARAKIKVAASLFPEFEFVAVQYRKRDEDKKVKGAPKVWMFERFSGAVGGAWV
ncbi:MAG: PDDEXK family nuclease [Syntrophorhabdaceae bacterium]